MNNEYTLEEVIKLASIGEAVLANELNKQEMTKAASRALGKRMIKSLNKTRNKGILDFTANPDILKAVDLIYKKPLNLLNPIEKERVLALIQAQQNLMGPRNGAFNRLSLLSKALKQE